MCVRAFCKKHRICVSCFAYSAVVPVESRGFRRRRLSRSCRRASLYLSGRWLSGRWIAIWRT